MYVNVSLNFIPFHFFRYKGKHSLIRHLRHEHSNHHKFSCPECLKKFSHGFIVMRHLQQVHKMEAAEAQRKFSNFFEANS